MSKQTVKIVVAGDQVLRRRLELVLLARRVETTRHGERGGAESHRCQPFPAGPIEAFGGDVGAGDSREVHGSSLGTSG